MIEKLAILGGEPVISESFAAFNPYGPEEVAAATRVIESGVLSKFIGAWTPDFYGGPRVQELERAWEHYFRVPHAVSMNSNTSGLIAAVGALGIEPYDEVIVSPWTMCASATAILVWNAIPVFADIEPDTFNLSPRSIEERITPRTKAIVVTDIFGHAAELHAIMAIARKHGLKVIEDAAQAPGALYHDAYVGTVADIGVFSLNYHKHIHTGEGGVCVTHDAVLMERMQLLRNHAEAVVGAKGVTDLSNMVGFNFRMGEIEAAMGVEQLKKLERIGGERTRAGTRLSDGLRGLAGLTTPAVKEGCTHVYYVYPLLLDAAVVRVPRARIVEALKAEGVVDVGGGYVNAHLLPMYQKRIAYGRNGYPWKGGAVESQVSYQKGICPVAERFHDEAMLGLHLCARDFGDRHVDLIIKAFHKVWSQLGAL